MHARHRNRLIGKMLKTGKLHEHELLEVLLFNACPRKDVNHLAHTLLNTFGSIEGVLAAGERELLSVKGVGEAIAQYLVCMGKCLRVVNGRSNDCFIKVTCTAEFIDFLHLRIQEGFRGKVVIYCLDKLSRIKRACEISKGGEVAVGAFDSVAKFISVYEASGVFAAHFREDGIHSPTAEDDEYVRLLEKVCAVGGIRIHDYCIINPDGETYSYFVNDRLWC